MSTVYVNFEEAFSCYGINVAQVVSNKGYTITSDSPISKSEVNKIQQILGAHRMLEMTENERNIREKKFENYVAWRPQSEWGDIAEYSIHYFPWKTRLKDAQNSLATIQQQYKITNISVIG